MDNANEIRNSLQINLDAPLGKMQTVLQHLSDLATFGQITADNAKEEDYVKHHSFFRFFPAHNNRLSFEQVRDNFKRWCLVNSLRDGIENLSAFLEEVNLVCGILKLSDKKGNIKMDAYKQVIRQERKKFHKKGFPEKIDTIRTEYGVSSCLESHVLSLNKARNCLAHRLGFVAPEDFNADDCLIIKFFQIQLFTHNPEKSQEIIIAEPFKVVEEGWGLAMRFKDSEKRFNQGEQIVISSEEHVQGIITFFWFAQQIRDAVCKYAGIEMAVPQKSGAEVVVRGEEIAGGDQSDQG